MNERSAFWRRYRERTERTCAFGYITSLWIMRQNPALYSLSAGKHTGIPQLDIRHLRWTRPRRAKPTGEGLWNGRRVENLYANTGLVFPTESGAMDSTTGAITLAPVTSGTSIVPRCALEKRPTWSTEQRQPRVGHQDPHRGPWPEDLCWRERVLRPCS
jgi:hypothetical protein